MSDVDVCESCDSSTETEIWRPPAELAWMGLRKSYRICRDCIRTFSLVYYPPELDPLETTVRLLQESGALETMPCRVRTTDLAKSRKDRDRINNVGRTQLSMIWRRLGGSSRLKLDFHRGTWTFLPITRKG